MSGKRIRVFVASPGDVQRERESLLGVVNELNRTCDSLLGQGFVRLELVRWETDTYSDVGRPQAVITEQIGDYDIFIGILWTRLGTPTGKAASGTIEEYETAYARWKRLRRPHICFYFNVAASPPPRTESDAQQGVELVKFRERLASVVLVHEYDGAALFADTVRPQLAQIVGREFLRVGSASARTANGKAPGALDRAVTLVAIGPQDACYVQRSKYLGHAGVVIEAEERDGWLRGTFRFDKPLFDGDSQMYSFLQFQVEPSNRRRQHEQVKKAAARRR
jgi:Domain of unknown function (DUF4062)